MNLIFTDRTRRALAAAQQESRRYRHGFVGTEHILLGLVDDTAGEVACVLASFGVDPPRIRQEVETLIASGAASTSTDELPLTPRAQQSIEIAAEEARDANQKEVDAGHLLLGLMREANGVAAQVLIKLGLNLREVREEVLKIRHAQMKLVERVVRPVRASAVRKRKMREELLAHLSGIYEEEHARWGNPPAALRAAADRFGDPAALAGELNCALPLSEKANYFINRSLGWRPPESAAHYMLRFATGMTLFVAVFLFCGLLPIGVFLPYGWSTMLLLARPLVGDLPFMFVDTWLLGLLYFKLRDAMWGAPWACKSLPLTIVSGGLIALVSFGTAIAFIAVANVDGTLAARAMQVSMAVAVAATIIFPIVARVNGPVEIADIVWARLDLEQSKPDIAS